LKLKDKTALIAGAGRNNGKAIALAFAREGADLILVARERREELNQVCKQCEKFGVKTFSMLGDVGKPDNVKRIVEDGLKHFGKVDVLVDVAGMRLQKLPWDITDDEWHQVFAVNLHSTFYLARALAPSMIERKTGSIIALGGQSALTAASPYAAALAASKHGLHGLIKALAQAFGPHGVRANLLALANIENERLNPEWYAARGGGTHINAQMTEATALKRQGTPEEVANVAVFLASDDSSYVTGDRIVCAGGIYM
jgi:NAD(P)-dependent dehydrogenase (short-subunit alcohol dehydrogenase family)